MIFSFHSRSPGQPDDAGGRMVMVIISEARDIFKRDRKNHKSPNSAIPSVAAGLLGIELGGIIIILDSF